MEFTSLHDLNIQVPRITLGTWAIGGWMWGGTDEAESIRTIHAAIDKDITVIDTAPVYGQGTSETIVGKALAQDNLREKVLISTKAGLEWDEETNTYRNASPDRLMMEIDESLRRLQTDHIDIYYVHWPDPLVEMEETAAAMRKILESGKIRVIGASNFSPEQMDAFRKEAPLHIIQPPYNLFERGIEDDVLPYAEKEGIDTMTYGVLCRGLLTGKFDEDADFEGDDLRKVDPKFKGDRFKQYLNAVNALDKWSQENFSRPVLHLAVRWVLDQPGITTAIWGARRPDQLDPINDVFDWKLSDSDKAEIERIVDQHVKDPVGPEFMSPPTRKER